MDALFHGTSQSKKDDDWGYPSGNLPKMENILGVGESLGGWVVALSPEIMAGGKPAGCSRNNGGSTNAKSVKKNDVGTSENHWDLSPNSTTLNFHHFPQFLVAKQTGGKKRKKHFHMGVIDPDVQDAFDSLTHPR